MERTLGGWLGNTRRPGVERFVEQIVFTPLTAGGAGARSSPGTSRARRVDDSKPSTTGERNEVRVLSGLSMVAVGLASLATLPACSTRARTTAAGFPLRSRPWSSTRHRPRPRATAARPAPPRAPTIPTPSRLAADPGAPIRNACRIAPPAATPCRSRRSRRRPQGGGLFGGDDIALQRRQTGLYRSAHGSIAPATSRRLSYSLGQLERHARTSTRSSPAKSPHSWPGRMNIEAPQGPGDYTASWT